MGQSLEQDIRVRIDTFINGLPQVEKLSAVIGKLKSGDGKKITVADSASLGNVDKLSASVEKLATAIAKLDDAPRFSRVYAFFATLRVLYEGITNLPNFVVGLEKLQELGVKAPGIAGGIARLGTGVRDLFALTRQRVGDGITKVKESVSGLLGKLPGLASSGAAAAGGIGAVGAAGTLAAVGIGAATIGVIGIAAAIVALIPLAIAAGKGIFSLAEQFSEAGSKIHDVTQRSGGFSAESISAIKVAAETSGSSLDEAGNALAKFAKNVSAAKTGNDELRKIFQGLEIDLTQGVEPAFKKFLVVFNSLPESAERNALEAKLFNDKTGALIPTLTELGKNFDAYKNKVRALGLEFTDHASKAADEFGDTLDILKLQGVGVAAIMAQEFTPTIIRTMNVVSKFVIENRETFRRWGTTINDVITGAVSAAKGIGDFFQSEFGKMALSIANVVAHVIPLVRYLEILKLLGGEINSTQPAEDPFGPGGALRGGRKNLPGTAEFKAEQERLADQEASAARLAKIRGLLTEDKKEKKAGETNEEKAIRLTDEFIRRLKEEATASNKANEAFFQRRNLFKEEIASLELIRQAYDKLTPAQRLSILEAARESGNTERRNAGAQIYAELLEEQTKAINEARGATDEYSKILDEAIARFTKIGTKMDEAQRKNLELAIIFRVSAEHLRDLNSELERMPALLAGTDSPFADKAFDKDAALKGIGRKLEDELGPPPEIAPTYRSVFGQIADAIKGTLGQALEGIGRTFTDLITGAQTLGQAFRNFALTAIDAISQVILKMLILRAIQAISGLFGGGGTAAAGSSFTSGVAGGIGFATGGNIPATSGGRLINVGEAGYDELVVSTDPRHAKRTASLIGQFIKRTGILPTVDGFNSSSILGNISARIPSFAAGDFVPAVGPQLAGAGGEQTINLGGIQLVFPNVKNYRDFQANKSAMLRDLGRSVTDATKRRRGDPVQ